MSIKKNIQIEIPEDGYYPAINKDYDSNTESALALDQQQSPT